jgi:hypothetical protein
MPEIPNLPDEHLRAIGLVTVRWNHLEQIVNLFLIHLLGKSIDDERSHIVFAHMAWPQKVDVLSALVEKVLVLPTYSSLKNYKPVVLPLLKAAQNGRNSITHGLWGTLNGLPTKASITARGSLKFTWTEANLKEIEAVTQAIEDARVALSALASDEWKESIRIRKEGSTEKPE